jgi:hypothetical protein
MVSLWISQRTKRLGASQSVKVINAYVEAVNGSNIRFLDSSISSSSSSNQFRKSGAMRALCLFWLLFLACLMIMCFRIGIVSGICLSNSKTTSHKNANSANYPFASMDESRWLSVCFKNASKNKSVCDICFF